jgi:hypothetical protein
VNTSFHDVHKTCLQRERVTSLQRHYHVFMLAWSLAVQMVKTTSFSRNNFIFYMTFCIDKMNTFLKKLAPSDAKNQRYAHFNSFFVAFNISLLCRPITFVTQSGKTRHKSRNGDRYLQTRILSKLICIFLAILCKLAWNVSQKSYIFVHHRSR